MANAATLSGSEKAAVFLMSLGEAEAAEIMRHMSVSDVQKIGQAMAAMRKISRDEADNILGTFADNVQSEAPLLGRSPQFLKRILSTSLGEERARSMLERLDGDTGTGLDSLQLMSAKEVTEIIHGEHPQIIAIVLAGLDATKASEVVSELPDNLASDIISRIANMSEVPQEAIEELDRVLQQNSSRGSSLKQTTMGGVRSAAQILNSVGKDATQKIIETLDEQDAALSQNIQDNMFVFENLLDVDDRGIQALVREITSDTLIVALKGADEAIQNKIFGNMSKRAAELLKDDLEAKGPVKISDVEAAQKEIVGTARRLADEGTILLGNSSDDFV